MSKKELTEEEKIDNQILELIMKKKGVKTAQDVSKTLNSMYGKVIQRLLDAEFDEFMKYEKGSHEEKKTTNRRNGSTSKRKKVKVDRFLSAFYLFEYIFFHSRRHDIIKYISIYIFVF